MEDRYKMGATSCLYLIHSMDSSFSEKEHKIASCILAAPADSVHPSIEELADRIGVSVSTLLRFVRKLGYDGYQQFRIALATEALAPEARFYEAPVRGSEDAVTVVFGEAVKALEMTAAMLDRAALRKTAELACGARRLLLLGLGGSGLVARDAFHKLIRSGLPCQTAEDYHLQLMLASQAGPRDLAILVSHTGINKDALALAEALGHAGCPVVAMTTYPRSPLARMADIVLLSAAPGSSVISEAFSARIAQLAMIDALYVQVMEILGDSGMHSMERMRSEIARRRT